jgi:hypothetical protein
VVGSRAVIYQVLQGCIIAKKLHWTFTSLHIVMSCVYLLLLHDIIDMCSSHCVSIATSYARYHEFLVNRTPTYRAHKWVWYWGLSHRGIFGNISLYDQASVVLGHWVQRLFSWDLKVVEAWSLLPGYAKQSYHYGFFLIHLWFMVC